MNGGREPNLDSASTRVLEDAPIGPVVYLGKLHLGWESDIVAQIQPGSYIDPSAVHPMIGSETCFSYPYHVHDLINVISAL